jgi:2-polyprenyl-3-methyl-5-hydroxy-6-metoxy-1,4-benzoquinol methylase
MKCNFCGQHLKEYLISTHFSIRKCVGCNIAMTLPIPKVPDYNKIEFNPCSKENGLDQFKLTNMFELPFDWRQLIEIQIDIIVRNIPAKAKILEIGCGEGILLYELQNSSFNVTGIEPSSAAFKKAQNRGLNIINGFFPGVNLSCRFDLVVLSQVLEHIFDVEEFIRELRMKIPKGYLLLTQTNFKGLIPVYLKDRWYAWVPEQHFWHFTLEGLTEYLIKNDFELIEYRYSSLVHPHNFLYKLATLNQKWHDQFTVLFKYNGY